MIPQRHTLSNMVPVNLTADEHRAFAERLRRAESDAAAIFTLIAKRYPVNARVRYVAANAEAGIKNLRLALASIAGVELPSAGVDYLKGGIV
jgi:hypothetical protein